MFYDPIEAKVIDYVDGQDDLKSRLIRTIGDAKTRFGEDYLRMLRAIRFSSQLGFEIESATWQAIQEISPNIANISGERIAMELENMLTHPNRSHGGQMLVESKLAKYIFPNISDSQYQAGIVVLGKLRKNVSFALALAALFAEVSTSVAVEQLEILKLSRSQIKHIEFLLAHRGVLLNAQMPIAAFKRLLAQPYFRDLFELQRALQKARGESVSQLVEIKNRARALAGQELTPKPILNGHELIELGAVPGPQVGQVAEEMYVEQLGGQFSSPDDARLWVKSWVKKHARE
jgi:tRNA nucleotidyltransferase/poly(A) polymerase